MAAQDIPSDYLNSLRQAKPLAVRIREACRLTGIGRSKLYELIAVGEIETIKVGASTLIPISSLERFLERHQFCR